MGVFRVTLVGMRFYDTDAESAACFSSFFLAPEPENKFDPNAVRVWGVEGDAHILLGHVSKSSQARLPFLPQEGRIFFRHETRVESPFAVELALLS